jgi:hypothetical protein
MTDMEKIAWGIVASLVVALVVAIAKAAIRRREERVSLKASLSIVGGLEMLTAIGCPSLVLQLSCSGKRAAKVRKASVCLVGKDLLAAFQKGFGTDFGYVPPRDPDLKQTLAVDLLPLSPPTVPEGYVLERGDICRFALPMMVPGLGRFAEAPSEDVTVRVEFFDGKEDILMQGLSVQGHIGDLIGLYEPARHRLNPGITIPISIRAISAAPPDLSTVGSVNPRPVDLSHGRKL